MAALTLREHQFYDALHATLGHWVLYSDLCTQVTGYDDPSARVAMRTHMSRLRRKLPQGSIESSYRYGYRLTAAAAVEHAVFR